MSLSPSILPIGQTLADAGEKRPCACGVCHTLKTDPIVFGSGTVARLKDFIGGLAPPLCAVLLVSDQAARGRTNRLYEKMLTRLGYRVRAHTFEADAEPTAANAFSVKVFEDTKLILGVGGGTLADMTKFVAAAYGIPCAFILTDPAAARVLAPSATLLANGVGQTYRTPPFAALFCDTDIFCEPFGESAAAFGEFASKAIGLFDYKFAALVGGERFCPHLFDRGGALLDEALIRFSAAREKPTAAQIAESGLSFSALGGMMGNSRLLAGGEAQTAHVLGLLLKRERRPTRRIGELELLAARRVAGLYQGMLGRPPRFFVPPPDNNLRLSLITEFLGVTETAAMRKIRPLPSFDAMRLSAYRFYEYRGELLREAEIAAARIAKAWNIFKRLYPDDGFAVTKCLEPPDLSLAVALAPDLKEKFTLLSYMKDTGVLDVYIDELK